MSNCFHNLISLQSGYDFKPLGGMRRENEQGHRQQASKAKMWGRVNIKMEFNPLHLPLELNKYNAT